ncbi:hypothetical protein MN116_002669 [Schistosoma mekongi]|uniref:Uncharacterized protein n=1 Tax=Schistosoma mekongi TaxID=38744 RepID=A0AAE2D5M6_SCHME|nr:hypothetical protein MN116_002669 [Schistosoma mekongi]
MISNIIYDNNNNFKHWKQLMNCRCCLQTKDENTGPSVTVLEENIEDGDILQEIGNAQYTLDFLRQVVQQSTSTGFISSFYLSSEQLFVMLMLRQLFTT